MIIRRDCLLTRSVSTIDETRPNGRKKKNYLISTCYIPLITLGSLALPSVGPTCCFSTFFQPRERHVSPLSPPLSPAVKSGICQMRPVFFFLRYPLPPSLPPCSGEPRRNVECNSRLAPLAVRERNRSSLAETEPNKRRGFFFFFFFSFDSISSSLLWINRSLEESYKTTRAN